MLEMGTRRGPRSGPPPVRRTTVGEPFAPRLVGRDAELAALVRALDEEGPSVTFVHGPPGVGTSTLLAAFAAAAGRRGAAVHLLDGRSVEPTPDAFLTALAGDRERDRRPGPVLARLAAQGRSVLVLDHWEALGLLDDWLRHDVVPVLPDTVTVVVGGARPPDPAWRASADRVAPVRVLSLGMLPRGDGLRLLRDAGVTGEAAEHLYRLTRGLPLALQVAATATARTSAPDPVAAALPDVVATITSAYLDSLDAGTRAGVEALAVVRRGTAGLLRALLPEAAPALVDRLARLPFVEVAVDGLALHEAVAGPLAAAVRATDPERYVRHRRVAWRHATNGLATARRDERWRHTADLLYLLDHPLVRDAFFPPASPHLPVSAATAADLGEVTSITDARLPASRAAAVRDAVAAAPAAVRVARDGGGGVAGFLVALDRSALARGAVRGDAAARAVREHLRARPVPASQDVLVVLAALCRAEGEAPNAATAALWLDLKRLYLDRRGRLRRVYAVVADAPAFLAIAEPLGFAVAGPPVRFDGIAHHLAVLDLGPAGVDGWLARLADEQLGPAPDAFVLDPSTSTVRVGGGDPVTLSPLEFGVLAHLVARDGAPVGRAELIRHVWGHSYTGGSNVVDAVVRTLRRKLGGAGRVVGTVRGIGYRLEVAHLDALAEGWQGPAGATG
ncbi:winged helix-turn-helix domain-containing protein [Egicoccus sp. AB-alg2]|uniref:winged helix-turn-helix domain-containing protein n=1 Tax=Egicoccus sp. AB-alg2 TaxID=3242693 RepID=UPI00359D4343